MIRIDLGPDKTDALVTTVIQAIVDAMFEGLLPDIEQINITHNNEIIVITDSQESSDKLLSLIDETLRK